MNRSEHAYLALDGLSGSILQPYVMRLSAPVEAARARRAARALVAAYERLRAVIVPGWHLYAFRVLPDDALMDDLFDLAWHECHDVDPDEPAQVEAWHNRLLNEVVSMERGLGLRFHFVPHARTPLLVLSVHHILLDGRSMYLAMSDLLGLLNGHEAVHRPMEALSLIEAIAPRTWRDWPARLWASWRKDCAEARRRSARLVAHVPGLPRGPAHHYSAHAVLHHAVSVPSERLHAWAKQRKLSVNALVMAALAEAIQSMQPGGDGMAAQTAVSMRMSVDLRRFFPKDRTPVTGNYVGSYIATTGGAMPPEARAAELDQQSRQALGRFLRREMLSGYLLEETYKWLGRTMFSHAFRRATAAGVFDGVSCHLTTLGAIDAINPPGAAVQLEAIYGSVVSMITVLVAVVELHGRMMVTVSWQLSQRRREVIEDLMVRFDARLAQLVAERA